MPCSSPNTVGLLYSGGLDSSILLAQLLREGLPVQPIYVASRLAWEAAELPAARRFLHAVATPACRELIVLQMPADDLYGDHWSVTGENVPSADSPDEAVYLPGRNPLLVLKARMWCQLNGIGTLALGSLASNPFGDASEDFLRSFADLLDHATESRVELVRPLAHLTKVQVLELGHDLPLELTFSCIAPVGGLHCGECNKCTERQTAFQLFNHLFQTASHVSRHA
jgi:7-cyano-7-deazaguanine synthase